MDTFNLYKYIQIAELTKWEHIYYFNAICIVCRQNDEQIKKVPMFMTYTPTELNEFRIAGIQVLVNCIRFTRSSEKKIFKLIVNLLNNSNRQLQNTVFECLKLHTNRSVLLKVVNFI